MFPVTFALLLLFVNRTSSASISEDTELILVHGIFRHGEKTPNRYYPTDPNINNTLYPIGFGGLTNNGKMMAYQLGNFLRQTYGDFIGDDYREDIMEIRSKGITRSIMSAQLVAAGLWPPSKSQCWNPELAWQPIPVSYKSENDENLITPANCPFSTITLEGMKLLPEVQKRFTEPYKELMAYIEQHSGYQIKTIIDLRDIYSILRTESDMNLTMPAWTKNIYLEPLYSAASHVYEYYNFNPNVMRINIGYLLQKIVNDTLAKIGNRLSPPERKLFLYSGHETTIACMLQALKIFEPHTPYYSSILLLEVHKKADHYFLQILYKNVSTATDATPLKIPGCPTLCPIDQFIDMHKEILPNISIEEACSLKDDHGYHRIQ